MSNQATTTSQSYTNSNTSPWSVQIPYLTEAFQSAQNALKSASNGVAPTNYTAQFTPGQINSFASMMKYGNSNGQIPQSSADAGASMANSGAGATAAGLSGLEGFTPQGGTQSNINAANQYVAGQNIPAQVQADMLMANQEASENTLPQIARDAAGSGNINSNKNAIQQGIVERGLAQQAGALGAQLQANAYDTGLNLAEQNSEAANNNILTSLLGQVSGGTNAANAGVNANSAAIGQQGGLFNLATAGIAGENQAAQANLTNQQQQYMASQNDPFLALQNFYNIIGANNWGGSTQSDNEGVTSQTPSMWQTIGGLLGGLGGLFKSDRRIKKDVQKIGHLFNGLPVYRFRYKGDPTNALRIGLMAQDVEKVRPEAVVEIHGIKAVNYDLATIH